MIRMVLFIAMFIMSVCCSLANAQTYEIRGSVREWIGVFNQSPNEIDLSETRLKLELLYTPSFTDNAAFYVKNYYTYDGLEKNGSWNLQEAYMDYYTDLVDVRFGKQVIAWGKADELNPTDVLNPQNLSNFTESKSVRKVGLSALKADWKFHDFILESIWKPEYDNTKFPAPDSRWAFFSIPGLDSLPEPVYPENNLENTEWALKLSRTISMFDFSISYFDGWDHTPTSELKFNPVTEEMELESPNFKRTKMIGADFAGSVRSVGIWGEGAFFQTEDVDGTDSSIKNPYFQYVIGADYTFGYNINVNVQYFQEVITKIDNDAEKEAEEAIISKLGLGMSLQQGVSSRIEKKFGEGDVHSVALFSIYDIKNQGILLQPRLTLSLTGALDVEIGMIIFDGEDKSIFGTFNDNDECYLKSTYSF